MLEPMINLMRARQHLTHLSYLSGYFLGAYYFPFSSPSAFKSIFATWMSFSKRLGIVHQLGINPSATTVWTRTPPSPPPLSLQDRLQTHDVVSKHSHSLAKWSSGARSKTSNPSVACDSKRRAASKRILWTERVSTRMSTLLGSITTRQNDACHHSRKACVSTRRRALLVSLVERYNKTAHKLAHSNRYSSQKHIACDLFKGRSYQRFFCLNFRIFFRAFFVPPCFPFSPPKYWDGKPSKYSALC